MSDYYVNKDDQLSFKQIALGHYKKILEISTNEFVGGYYNYVHSGNTTNQQYVGDKRAEFSQSVETLALALYPFFDEQMGKDYGNYLLEREKLRKKYADEEGFITNAEEGNRVRHSVELLTIMKKLFRDLSCLMHRLDYFKGTSYSEGDIQDASDVVDIDGKEVHKTKEEKEDD